MLSVAHVNITRRAVAQFAKSSFQLSLERSDCATSCSSTTMMNIIVAEERFFRGVTATMFRNAKAVVVLGRRGLDVVSQSPQPSLIPYRT